MGWPPKWEKKTKRKGKSKEREEEIEEGGIGLLYVRVWRVVWGKERVGGVVKEGNEKAKEDKK